ncbi:hypothetical protein [Novipirellula galeiformis]|uniref:hypothetical protein n=1 Tax=Novipirellula galeiformis TaxID=2528004 RepID=UPI0011B62990|nr:hypothetical protein [Novipirellula galeiformis]
MNHTKKINRASRNGQRELPWQVPFAAAAHLNHCPSPSFKKNTREQEASDRELQPLSAQVDRGLRGLRWFLMMLVGGCLTLGAIVWWRLLH